MRRTALLFALFSCVPAPAQSPGAHAPDAVAFRYARGEITWADFDDFIGRVHRRSPKGQSALEHLVKRHFVEAEAARRGITVSDAEWSAFLARSRADLEKRGLGKLEDWLAREGIERASFERLARIDLLLEKLVRDDLRLGANATPTPAQSQLWLADKTKASARAATSDGARVVARIEGRDLTVAELGGAVREMLDRAALLELARDAAVEASVAHEARRRAVPLEAPQLDAELARMRKDLAEHPRLSGLPFAEYLTQLGHDEASLRLDPNFRTRAWLHALVASQRDAAGWREHYRARRAEFDRALGERRSVAWILCRGAAEANPLVARSQEQARAMLEELRSRLGAELSFAEAARLHSDHEASREFEGRLGWLTRLSTRAEKAVVDAAFELPAEQTSAPLRTRDGYALIRVLGIEPPPDEDAMAERVLAYEVSRERAALLQRLKLESRF
jgi:hypothetical protein